MNTAITIQYVSGSLIKNMLISRHTMTIEIFPTRQYKCFDHGERADFVHASNCIIGTRLPAVDQF